MKALRRSQNDHNHLCHAHGCERKVPPKLFMCSTHWFKLPKAMRDAIWAAYVPGQEVSKTPTAEYVRVAGRAITWLARQEGYDAYADWRERFEIGEPSRESQGTGGTSQAEVPPLPQEEGQEDR